MKLLVPYYSQFIDVDDAFWMLRACGAVCLKEVAEYHLSPNNTSYKKILPSIVDLCNEAKERDGYHMQNGWVHDYLVTKAIELGLHAYRKEGLESLDEIYESLNNHNPVIVSVEKNVLEQTRYHMIVLVGYDETEYLHEDTNAPSEIKRSFYYHESESTDKDRGAYRVCDETIFLQYFRGKAIFISK